MLTRREVVSGGAALLAAGCTLVPEGQRAALGFRSIERVVGGRVGVAALDTGAGAMIGYRQHERFAMASTFKWLLAAGILKRAQHGMSLDDRVLYGRNDLVVHSPVCEARIDPATGIGRMTLKDLCEATVTVSDNCAANLLLVPMMGPEGLTRFFREAGDRVTRLDRNEPALNENAPGDERDTTTPESMMRTMARLLTTDDVLRAPMRDMLLGWLASASTGLDRLRAGFPADWAAGDKTGTGGNGAHNDVAIAFPPRRKPIVIASYLSESTAPNADKAAAHKEIARLIVEEFE
jgi:beta-lactamase class A